MAKVLYPGSFDPITKGHMNIIEQASELFDEVVVAVMQNSKKTGLFTLKERLEMVNEIYKDNAKVKVVTGDGASVDLALLYDCKAIVRGLRGLTDFDYEIQLSQINKDISDNRVNTICFFADSKYQSISSSMVKEVFGLNKDIDRYVDSIVVREMQKKRV